MGWASLGAPAWRRRGVVVQPNGFWDGTVLPVPHASGAAGLGAAGGRTSRASKDHGPDP